MIDVAIVGATGYTALELAKILLRHPEARVVMATSRAEEPRRLDQLHPSLSGRIELMCEPYDADELAARCGAAFLALPHGASLEAVPGLRRRGVRVIDLSADYRLKDAQAYADWYEHAHSDPAGLEEAVYGLPELFRDEVRRAQLIANPGCYTSASILGLAPLVAEGLIERTGIIIDAKSGVSGAGRTPKLNTHFPECNESLSAYGVGRHRHTPEIDAILTRLGSEEAVEVIFTPHLAPMDRGILATIYAAPVSVVSEHQLMELYRSFYQDSAFIRVVKHLPGTKDSAHTNYCDITLRLVRGKIVVISCLDNLIKGASGVAVQNFNLMNGLPETLGLL
jgi:N-acetyl-gamma-glutamyl-phosphate reductase